MTRGDRPLETSVRELSGVGPGRAKLLERIGIETVGDLLFYRPRRYEDRRHVRTIGQLQLGEELVTQGRVVALGSKRYSRGRKSVFEVIMDDGTGRLHCRWWNAPYMENRFRTGEELVVFGKVRYLKPRTIDHPETERAAAEESASSIHVGRIVPVYPLTEGLSQRWLRALIWQVLEEWQDEVVETGDSGVFAGFPKKGQAVQSLHFPETLEEAERARQRLALEEFIGLQRALRERRQRMEAAATARPCPGTNELIKRFLGGLEFELTAAQKAVLREIRQDLNQGTPMRRLLQGDVGSGKTVVAALAALMSIESGFDVALMAPTEILAEQHYKTFLRWFRSLEAGVFLHTGSHKSGMQKQQEEQLLDLGQRTPVVVVGTHALIEESFGVEELGLVIIDEQHKFGVAQREKLLRKGTYPHLLVMTATPIPRTLGLTVYGDLDMSVIRELPPGRRSVRTYVRPPDALERVWAFVKEKVGEGRQAYVVYPRLEEAEPEGVKAVLREKEKLQKIFEPFRVEVVHGRLKGQERDQVMEAFWRNEVQVLLATPVIEVGVDVSNATVMVIEGAERFGLAQLHQLRGRVGRGAAQSYCVLVTSGRVQENRRRLKVMEQSTDGFRIAEEDMRLRGPGEFLGKEQSGMAGFKFGDLNCDLELVERARRWVGTGGDFG